MGMIRNAQRRLWLFFASSKGSIVTRVPVPWGSGNLCKCVNETILKRSIHPQPPPARPVGYTSWIALAIIIETLPSHRNR